MTAVWDKKNTKVENLKKEIISEKGICFNRIGEPRLDVNLIF